ncbi:hypothetical protein tinsulaeT_11060 [Thalassotalea insulae]|uniref:Solute-binding protein family 3/N-terminal domain-containing protein n=1 Tax=Thalassotalea insulae TaxID=2056778 RepID=A0ABQ6GUC9_9GAMM|nr:hypothetical protein [Thalassotalea insulae]GLX77766.1 hypothetical protein tinsulaeT_11060 [Thalassotalea insulae]
MPHLLLVPSNLSCENLVIANLNIVVIVALTLFSAKNSNACLYPERVFVVGVEAIEYSPHYNFVSPSQPNFFGDFIKWLERKTQCQFLVRSLPIKRLVLEYEQAGKLDFIYPDNPNWHRGQGGARYFSEELITALGTTIVQQQNLNIQVSNFNSLAFPRGFSPVAWYPLQNMYDIKFIETTNALAALKMVDTERADGADIEYNVAQYLMRKNHIQNLKIAKNLPFTPTSFHLSTLREVKMLNYINLITQQHKSEIIKIKQRLHIIEKLPQ